jgi:hypothetical protein
MNSGVTNTFTAQPASTGVLVYVIGGGGGGANESWSNGPAPQVRRKQAVLESIKLQYLHHTHNLI